MIQPLSISSLVGFALLGLTLSGCAAERFPASPEDHRLYDTLQSADHEYYRLVRSGVASNLVDSTPRQSAREAAATIRRHWAEIDRIDLTDHLAEYLTARGLGQIVERFEATLRENGSAAPPTGINEHLEAAAVKQGLVDAVFALSR